MREKSCAANTATCKEIEKTVQAQWNRDAVGKNFRLDFEKCKFHFLNFYQILICLVMVWQVAVMVWQVAVMIWQVAVMVWQVAAMVWQVAVMVWWVAVSVWQVAI